MLSLLSLLIASGTVLRPDTELWTPASYPDPRTNATLCNSKENATVCDPDHLLSDQWRSTIDETVKSQMEKIRAINIEYVDDAPEECGNGTDPFSMYVLLARRINSTSNGTVTSDELKTFGDGLVETLGLSNQTCKNFLVLIVVETAHSAYVRTGKHMKITRDLMEQAFNHSANPFSEKNYMEVLNQIVEKLGDSLVQTFAPPTEPPTEAPQETTAEVTEASTAESSTQETTESRLKDRRSTRASNFLFYIAMLFLVVIALCAIVVAALIRTRKDRVVGHFKPPSVRQFGEFTNAYQHSPTAQTITIPQLHVHLDDDIESDSSICGKSSLTATTLSTDAALPKVTPPCSTTQTL